MIRKLARPMLASVFIADGADTVLNAQAHVEGTEQNLTRVRSLLPRKYARLIPSDPAFMTRVVGGTKVGAGSMLALGKAPRTSAATLALLSVPTILSRNAFWETQDREEKIARRQGFLTNVALLGGLAITSMDTEGKPGMRWRANHAAKIANKKVQKALPTKSETEKFAENAQKQAAVATTAAKGWLGDAGEKVNAYASKAQDYVEANKDDWISTAQETAGQAREKVAEASASAQDFLNDNKDDWLKTAQENSKVAKKRAVKAAALAQERAEHAFADAQRSRGRAYKKANKRAEKLQAEALKRLEKAQKKVKDL